MKNSTKRGLRGIVAIIISLILGFIIACQTERTTIGDIALVLGLINVIYMFCNAVLFYRDLDNEEKYNNNGME